MSSSNSISKEDLDNETLSRYATYILRLVESGTAVRKPPAEGTRLARADEALEGFPITHEIERLLTVSLDHLHALTLLLTGSGAVLPHASLTLLRGSLENIGHGMWLLGAGSTAEMITRTLIRTRQNAYDMKASTPNGRADDEYKRQVNRLKEIARKADGVTVRRVKEEKPSSLTCINEGAQAFALEDTLPILWQITSGVSHGRTWALLATTVSIEVPGTRHPNGAAYHLTSETDGFQMAFFNALVAHEVLSRTLEGHKQGNRVSPGLTVNHVVEEVGLPPKLAEAVQERQRKGRSNVDE